MSSVHTTGSTATFRSQQVSGPANFKMPPGVLGHVAGPVYALRVKTTLEGTAKEASLGTVGIPSRLERR